MISLRHKIPPLPRDLAQLLVALDIHTKNSFKNHNLKKLLLKQSISATLSTNNLKICTLEKVKDRKSTRLNSSHVRISYAVFCLKKKTKKITCFIHK